MIRKYAIYKGLQKPLIYRGFKGKFIGWGIASLIAGLITGGLLGALSNRYLGALLTVVCIASGLTFTFSRQKKGLHTKRRHPGIFIHPVHLKKNYVRNNAKEEF
jgi:hypothetical protein